MSALAPVIETQDPEAPNTEAQDSWTVAGRTFTSRLIIGTGKYKDYALNAAAAEASGAQIVTVALRRVNLSDPSQPISEGLRNSTEPTIPLSPGTSASR